MPIVTIQMIEGRTVEQKRELVEAITKEVCRIAKVEPQAVTIIIQDMATHNLGKAGRLRCDIDAEKNKS
ncbi:MAG: tautomerase family protein [Bacillota bacterium]